MQRAFTRIAFPLLTILVTATAAWAQSGTIEGVITAHKGSIVTIAYTLEPSRIPATGTTGDMSKYFEEKLGKMNMSGWLGIARVEFVPTKTAYMDLKIVEEKSEITVNGEKVDHFKVGNRVKIDWPAAAVEPETETETK